MVAGRLEAATTSAMADSSDDDFAMAMYESMESKKRSQLLEDVEAKEVWWIVVAPRVAVRPATTTEGKPLAVLPRLSVVRAGGVEKVGRDRWLRLHAGELGFFARKKSGAKPDAAFMLIDGTVSTPRGLGSLCFQLPGV